MSMPLRMKVWWASFGEFAIGSPLRLNDVFITMGMPVFVKNFFMSA